MQMTKKSQQDNKGEQSWETDTTGRQYKTVWYWLKNRQIDQ